MRRRLLSGLIGPKLTLSLSPISFEGQLMMMFSGHVKKGEFIVRSRYWWTINNKFSSRVFRLCGRHCGLRVFLQRSRSLFSRFVKCLIAKSRSSQKRYMYSLLLHCSSQEESLAHLFGEYVVVKHIWLPRPQELVKIMGQWTLLVGSNKIQVLYGFSEEGYDPFEDVRDNSVEHPTVWKCPYFQG